MEFMFLITLACSVIWNHQQVQASISYYMSDEVKQLARQKRDLLPNELEKQIIVDKHNYLRANVGNEGTEPTPSDMRYMTWDDGLAYSSLLYSQQCKWEHSLKSERRTLVFKYGVNGENLWSGSGELAIEFDPNDAITNWYNEQRWYFYYNGTCQSGHICEHYTQIVWAWTYKVGCAWSICPRMTNLPGRHLLYFVCQYSPGGNIETVRPYRVGPRCSQCQERDTCWENSLCRNSSRDEIIPFTPPPDGNSISLYLSLILIFVLMVGLGGTYLCTKRYTSKNEETASVEADFEAVYRPIVVEMGKRETESEQNRDTESEPDILLY